MSSEAFERAATLAHDVGKYVSRIARNVPAGGAVPAALLPLLAKDLFERPGGGRPSARLRELAEGLTDPRVARARALLAEVDALEAAVRRGEDPACRRACAIALEVEAALRSLAEDASAVEPAR